MIPAGIIFCLFFYYFCKMFVFYCIALYMKTIFRDKISGLSLIPLFIKHITLS